jgi:non-ribosomal peptide synthetase component E (peptide arylation enzyme)
MAAGLRRLGLARRDRSSCSYQRGVPGGRLWPVERVLPVFALPPHREHEIDYLVLHSVAVAYLAAESFGGFQFGELVF